MNFFKKIFGGEEGSEGEEEMRSVPWKSLSTMDQLDDIAARSNEKPQVIFKHSTRCGISRMVLGNFEREYNLEEGQVDLYFLDLISFRDVSSEIAVKFQVLHESPQMIIVKNGATVYHASHSAIDSGVLHKYV